MTWNTFFEMVATGNITDEVMAKAQTKVDKASAETSAKIAKREAIFGAVTSEPQTAQEIADALDGKYSRQCVSSVLVLLAKSGEVVKSDDTPRTYTLATE